MSEGGPGPEVENAHAGGIIGTVEAVGQELVHTVMTEGVKQGIEDAVGLEHKPAPRKEPQIIQVIKPTPAAPESPTPEPAAAEPAQTHEPAPAATSPSSHS